MSGIGVVGGGVVVEEGAKRLGERLMMEVKVEGLSEVCRN